MLGRYRRFILSLNRDDVCRQNHGSGDSSTFGGAIMAYKGSGKKAKIQSLSGSRSSYNKSRPSLSSKKDYSNASKKQTSKNHGTNRR